MTDVAGFRLDSMIGRGSEGEVWLAWPKEPGDPMPVALKILRDRPQTPTMAGRTGTHPNLLRVTGVVRSGRDLILVMPFLGGGSMRDLLSERGTLDPGEVAGVLMAVASAIEALHRSGVVHGDLKPENVMFAADGQPFVADPPFDLGGGPVKASVGYAAPELALRHEIGPAVDVFALGVIAYEALTGRRPHRGDERDVLVAASAGSHRPLASWPSISGEVARVVEGALESDPARRPSSPVTWAEQLAATAGGDGVRLPGPASVREVSRAGVCPTAEFGPRPPALSRPRRRVLTGPGWVALAALVMVVGLWLLVHLGSP